MMNKKLHRLAQRRERLIAEAAAQRVALAQIANTWRKPLDMADKGLNMVRYVKRHPLWLAGGGAALLTIFRSNYSGLWLGKWLGRSLAAWQIARKIRSKFLSNEASKY